MYLALKAGKISLLNAAQWLQDREAYSSTTILALGLPRETPGSGAAAAAAGAGAGLAAGAAAATVAVRAKARARETKRKSGIPERGRWGQETVTGLRVNLRAAKTLVLQR